LLDTVVTIKNFPVVLGSGKGNFSFAAKRELTYEPVLITVNDCKFMPVPQHVAMCCV
jgi:hypothetical protein